ncbi:MAG: Uma2 family endonuclease [Hyphomicrobiaceae bacterium]
MTAETSAAHDDDLMTIEEFLAFTEARPEGEKWELIEGVPVMSPSPTDVHQVIVGNIIGALWQASAAAGASWLVMPGTGTRVPASSRSLPEPDVFVKERPPIGSPVSDEALVIIEVLSRSNRPADRAWRRRVYASVPNCRHYVTVSARGIEVVAHHRAEEWQERPMHAIADVLELPAIGATLPLATIYRAIPFAERV